MCYWLGRVRNSEFPKTRNIIDTLIIWCIESTVAKGGASVIQLILFQTRNDLLWMIFWLPKASLFSNSMLAALNGRNRIINSNAAGDSAFITFSSSNPAPPRPSKNVVIQMTHITETRIDDEHDECKMEAKTNVEEFDSQKEENCH
ncbi:Saposin B-type domain-containing protein [Mycena sanguinolenta]|uniref:Saposin B-type domain-containing protein n=1 Tax=Mycena sanguinolenta TaxID=230812 RepID=A0A8H6ZC35_9AGAR|nr:Saposin B-type domain-containing protein [Mycena sanguinolenta]